MDRIRIGRLVAASLLAIGLCSTGCSEIEDSFEYVGTVRVFPVAPGLGAPTLETPATQAVVFRVTSAVATIDGETIDFVLGRGPCVWAQSSITVTPVAIDNSLPCAQGIVVGATETASPIDVDVELEIELHRTEPLLFDRNGDFDADGFPNFIDNCPLVFNPGQEDVAPQDGLGDACTSQSLRDPLLLETDSDADLYPDSSDNCDYFPLPGSGVEADQTDRSPFTNAPFGIGVDCPEQVAVVYQDGSPTIRLQATTSPVALERGFAHFLVLDYGIADTMDCNWDLGRCDLRTSSVGACVTTNIAEAVLGCTPVP